MSQEKNILVLGLGNDCLGDDAVGLRVVRELRRRLEAGDSGATEAQNDGVDCVEAGAGGMILLDLMTGYRRLILIDAIQTGGGELGRIYRLTEDQLPAGPEEPSTAPWSVHHMGLRRVLQTGREAGCRVPGDVVVYAVETDAPREWRRGCSPPVERAIPEVVRRVVGEIQDLGAAARKKEDFR